MAEFDLFSGNIDIIQMVLETFLRIDLSSIPSQYTATVSDQLLYLVLIPHTILLLFIFSFTAVVTQHKGIRTLLGIVSYLFLLLSGWYGNLVVLLNTYFLVLLGGGFLMFIMMKFFTPAAMPAAAGVAGGAAKAIYEKTVGKEMKRKELEKELKIVVHQINAIEMGGHSGGRGLSKEAQAMYIGLKAKKGAIEQTIRNL